jgi:Icc-related predicted phosphoesterase
VPAHDCASVPTHDCASVPAHPCAGAPAGAESRDSDGSIVVVGDTQRTYWAEQWFAFREQNETERQALLTRMACEERPSVVLHVGDMVSYGSSSSEWEYFDRLFAPLRTRKIHVYPVMGNHDYWGSDETALANVRARFPELAPHTYYTIEHAGLGLVFLDSNLEGEAAREQTRWFGERLDHLQKTTAGIVVLTHHPPFTLGEHRDGDRFVDTRALDLFFAHDKALLFLSGHVHGYERFTKRGRTFVVTGGGGGPRVNYRDASEASRQDPELEMGYRGLGVEKRPLHYVVLSMASGRLHGTVKCLPGPGCTDGELDHFDVARAPPTF